MVFAQRVRSVARSPFSSEIACNDNDNGSRRFSIAFRRHFLVAGNTLYCYRCNSNQPGCGTPLNWLWYWGETCPEPDDKCVKIIERKGGSSRSFFRSQSLRLSPRVFCQTVFILFCFNFQPKPFSPGNVSALCAASERIYQPTSTKAVGRLPKTSGSDTTSTTA